MSNRATSPSTTRSTTWIGWPTWRLLGRAADSTPGRSTLPGAAITLRATPRRSPITCSFHQVGGGWRLAGIPATMTTPSPRCTASSFRVFLGGGDLEVGVSATLRGQPHSPVEGHPAKGRFPGGEGHDVRRRAVLGEKPGGAPVSVKATIVERSRSTAASTAALAMAEANVGTELSVDARCVAAVGARSPPRGRWCPSCGPPPPGISHCGLAREHHRIGPLGDRSCDVGDLGRVGRGASTIDCSISVAVMVSSPAALAARVCRLGPAGSAPMATRRRDRRAPP